MNIYCEVCDCHIKKSNWGKHLKTTKHGIACGEIVVEEVEKKQSWKCRGHKGLEMFRGENATCNGCLAHREKWAGNNAEKVRELWQKYHAEHREEINKKRKCIINLRWIVLCVGAELGKINGQDMWGLGSICWGLRGGAVMEKLVGVLGGQRVGRTDHQSPPLLLYIPYIAYSCALHLSSDSNVVGVARLRGILESVPGRVFLLGWWTSTSPQKNVENPSTKKGWRVIMRLGPTHQPSLFLL